MDDSIEVTFDKGGGIGGTDRVSTAYGRPMPAIDIPIKSGSSFLGYFSASGVRYYSSTGLSAKYSDLVENATMYAQWKVAETTISLDAQLGVGGTESV